VKNRFFSVFATVGLGCGFFLSTPIASANVVGLLSLDAGSNSVTVGEGTINWNGMFTVAGSTTLTYNNGTALAAGTTGSLENLNAMTTVFPLNDFMTFTGAPGLDFTLDSIGPGSTDTNCAAATAVGDSCSVFAGSPFVLTFSGTGTTVQLSARGTATDSTGVVSDWSGTFSQPLTMLGNDSIPITPLDVQEFFANDPTGTITTPFSGQFIVQLTATPEPPAITMVLLGGGFLLAAFSFRRSHTRS
jgi:hypothetical protein